MGDLLSKGSHERGTEGLEGQDGRESGKLKIAYA